MARTLGDVLHLFLDEEPPAAAEASPVDARGGSAEADDAIVLIPAPLANAASAAAVSRWEGALASTGVVPCVVTPLGPAPDAWLRGARSSATRAILAADAAPFLRAVREIHAEPAERARCLLVRLPPAWLDAVHDDACGTRILLTGVLGGDAALAPRVGRWTDRLPGARVGLDTTGPARDADGIGRGLDEAGIAFTRLADPERGLAWARGLVDD